MMPLVVISVYTIISNLSVFIYLVQTKFCSQLYAIGNAPFFHYLNEVFDLRVVRILQHVDRINQPLFALLAHDEHLEHADGSTTFALEEFGIRVKAIKDIEGLH